MFIRPMCIRSMFTFMFIRAMSLDARRYVVPFAMGPAGSPIAKVGVQLTDSAYVAASMRVMTRMGAPALAALAEQRTREPHFVRAVHSVGVPKRRAPPCHHSLLLFANPFAFNFFALF